MYWASYKKYKVAFQKEKREGNVYAGVRQVTFNNYVRARLEGDTNRNIIAAQVKLSKAEKTKLWKKYQQFVKQNELSRGKSVAMEGTYWGGGEGKLGFHKTLSGLLRSNDGMHFVIASRIQNGEDRERVLDEYGY